MKPLELLRKNEQTYKSHNLKEIPYSEDEILESIIRNPNLVQRPIVERGEKAILARLAEKIRGFL